MINEDRQLDIKRIAGKYKLKLIIMFGSFATGKNREDSDVDIGVMGFGDIGFEDQVALINEFTQVLAASVDLTVLNHANPLLLFQASKNAVLLYGSQEEFARFKLRAFHAYNDYKPYFRMERELNKKIIKSYVD